MGDNIFSDILSRIGVVEKKVNTLETVEYIRFYPILYPFTYAVTTALTVGSVYTSANLRGSIGIGNYAKGFIGSLWIDPLDTDCTVRIMPSDSFPSSFGQVYHWYGNVDLNRQVMTQCAFVFLGTDGKIKIDCLTTNCTVYLTAFGYWE